MKPSDKKPGVDNYLKAHDIVEELLSVYESGGSVGDNEKIRRYFAQNPHSEQLRSDLSSPDLHRALNERLSSTDREEDMRSFIARLGKERPARPDLRRRRLAIAVPAAAVVLLALLFTGISGERQQSSVVYRNTVVAREITRPTLVLDNDDSIVLTGETTIPYGGAYSAEADGNRIVYTNDAQEETVRYNRLIIPKQFSYTVVLADGSEITLNANSTLHYPVAFADGAREIELTGEAFFRVMPSGKPFIVKTEHGSVTVYGTEFNVNTQVARQTEVALIEGSVGFRPNGGSEVMMRPDQLLVFDSASGAVTLGEVNGSDYRMWMENRFYFREQPLDKVLSSLSSWYGVGIALSEDLRDKKLTLIIDRDTSVDEIFDFIKEIMNLQVKKKGESYMIE